MERAEIPSRDGGVSPQGGVESMVAISGLSPHPISLEVYGDEDVGEKLSDSIRSHGILVPLAVKEDGTIISGHRRWRAARELGMEKVPVVFVQYSDELQEKEAILSFNEQRDKTYGQKMKEAEQWGAIEREKAKRRQGSRRDVTPGSDEPEVEKGERADEVVSKKAGFGSRATYYRAKKVWDESKKGNPFAQKEVEKLNKGQTTISSAHKRVTQLQERKEREEAIKNEPPPVPTGPFRVIVADPPWKFEKRRNDPTHRSEVPYPTMTDEAIKAMDIGSMASDDAILWLWTTNAHMEVALQVVREWGFTHKTILTWVKDRMGAGDWLRGKTEHCIMAVRGRPLVNLTNQTTVLHGKVREHSRKPEEFYELVETLCPGSKVELFARYERQGWASHGDEVEDSQATAADKPEVHPPRNCLE